MKSSDLTGTDGPPEGAREPGHHPPGEYLVDFTTGALDDAEAVVVECHLGLCARCAGAIAALETVGGILLDEIEGGAVNAGDLDAVLGARHEVAATTRTADDPRADHLNAGLPAPLRGRLGTALDDLDWSRDIAGVRSAPIPGFGGCCEATMVRIAAGRKVPSHGHDGAQLAIVLCGALASGKERFATGDVMYADETVVHGHQADTGQDCLCFRVRQIA